MKEIIKKKAAPRKKKVDNTISNGLTSALLGGLNNPFNSQLSQGDTVFSSMRWYLISNMRQLLSQMYVEHGIVKVAVDCPVEDGFRGKYDIRSKQLDEDQIQHLWEVVEREGDIEIVKEAEKYNRLYGGAAVLIITAQDPLTELDLEALSEDAPMKFRAVDMWELYYDKQNIEDQSVDAMTSIESDQEFYNYYGKKIHKSRVMILKGLPAPSFVRPRLRGWGYSVVEPILRSLNQYLKATDLAFECLDEFKIDVYKIKNLTNSLLSPNGEVAIQRRVSLANSQKNYQNAITMDSEDDYIQKQISLVGISEAMTSIRMQVASDLRMPLTKLFGISSAGFSSGEDDIENYNAMIESTIRAKCKKIVLRVLEIRCQLLFGFIPDDLSFEFESLRILSSEQQENVKTQKFQRLLQALQAGAMTSKEFKDACNKDNLLEVKLDTSVDIIDVLKEEESGLSTSKSISKEKQSETTADEAPKAKNSQDIENPGQVDEEKWAEAKKAAKEEGGGWALVSYIYKKMGGKFHTKNEAKEEVEDTGEIDEEDKPKHRKVTAFGVRG